ncbi:hypothetical protein AB0425_25885 [Actinosynnema sp. NPDC051121]
MDLNPEQRQLAEEFAKAAFAAGLRYGEPWSGTQKDLQHIAANVLDTEKWGKRFHEAGIVAIVETDQDSVDFR